MSHSRKRQTQHRWQQQFAPAQQLLQHRTGQKFRLPLLQREAHHSAKGRLSPKKRFVSLAILGLASGTLGVALSYLAQRRAQKNLSDGMRDAVVTDRFVLPRVPAEQRQHFAAQRPA